MNAFKVARLEATEERIVLREIQEVLKIEVDKIIGALGN